MIQIDEDISRRITKFSLAGYVILFFISPAQPLLCSTLMGLAAIAPILLGPNPLRVLGLLAFAVAGYLFWPEFQESKKTPTRNEVRVAVMRTEEARAVLAQSAVKNLKLPDTAPEGFKLPGSDKATYSLLPGGVIRVEMQFAPLQGLSLRLTPTLSTAAAGGPPPRVTWTCVSDDITQSYLPSGCRNSENLRKAGAQK